MKKLILLFSFTTFFSFAQNHKGNVNDEKTNLPLEDTNIYFNKFRENVFTNDKGEYNLNLLSGVHSNDSIYFSHIGYITKVIQLSELLKDNFIVKLTPDIEILNEILVNASKKLQPKIHFKRLNPLKKGISSFGCLLINDKIYVIGGDISSDTDAFQKIKYENPDFTLEDYMRSLGTEVHYSAFIGNLYIYDIKKDSWENSEIKFKKRAYHNINYYDNKLYVLGGKTRSVNGVYDYLANTIEVFDFVKKTITIDKTNPHQAINFSSFTYKDNIITLGGSTKSNEKGEKQYSNKVHSYDLKSGYWYQLEDMPSAKETNGVLIDNKIYLIGGYNNKPITEIETLDLISGKWTKEGDLLYAIDKPAITFNKETIYIFDNGRLTTYNTQTKKLREYLINLPLKNSKLYFDNNMLYILGGYTADYYSKFPSAELYSIDINEFDKTKINRFKDL